MPKQYKIDKVAEIESSIEANAGVFMVSYNGLTVKQAQELRHQLRELGAEMKVYKNNLVRIALENKEQPNVDDILVGPLAYVFYENEPVEAGRKALRSSTPKGVLEIKGGISEGKAVTAEEVNAIADLPHQDQLPGQIAGLINGFARTSLLRLATAFPAVSPVASSRSPSRRRPSRHHARGRKAAPLAHMRRAT